MKINKIKSNAKLNLALNITGKKKVLHKIESIISFIDLHDIISINQHNGKKHHISFCGKFSKNIEKKNTVQKLFQILDKENLLNNKKFKKVNPLSDKILETPKLLNISKIFLKSLEDFMFFNLIILTPFFLKYNSFV